MQKGIIWFRQDLRLCDNPALYNAVIENDAIFPLYILDDTLPALLGEAQRWWLHKSLAALQIEFKKKGAALILRKGNPEKILLEISRQYNINAVYWNRCYEPAVRQSDAIIQKMLAAKDIKVQQYNGTLLHEPEKIANKQGGYFKVFSYFWKKCCSSLHNEKILPLPNFKNKIPPKKSPKSDNLEAWRLLPLHPDWAGGFSEWWHPGEAGAHDKLSGFIEHLLPDYIRHRDFPAQHTVSGLSPHLHFGEISPRQILSRLKPIEMHDLALSKQCAHFSRELGWREFSYYLLYHFPELPEKNFKEKFDTFAWSPNKKLLSCWQKGRTGYPLVDAGMRQLWQTGYMHNRIRMITASFLTKNLLIDWREGAKWFWHTLLDADLASNSMNWQWVAGSGADAAPYFRIFNPITQSKKFDPAGEYIRHWIPELNKLPDKYIHQPMEAPPNILKSAGIILGKNYPFPIIDHTVTRQKALSVYRKLKGKKPGTHQVYIAS